MIYIALVLIVIGIVLALSLNYFFPKLGKVKIIGIVAATISIIGGTLFIIIYKAAHEMPPGAVLIDKSDIPNN